MTMRNSLVVTFVLLGLSLLVLAGCGSSEPTGGDAVAHSTKSGNQPKAASSSAPRVKRKPPVKSDNRTPEQVVTIFLESLRTGDDERMKQMFTASARGNHGLVAKQSNAAFEVFEAKLHEAKLHEEETQSLAYVRATWTTFDDQGQDPKTDNVHWALRKMPEGWRVAGMAIFIPELGSKEPVYLDFEDPVKMEATQKQIRQEMARRLDEQPAASVANKSGAPEAPTRK